MKRANTMIIQRSTTSFLFSLASLALGIMPLTVQGQLEAVLTSTENTNCNGTACNYNGPSILINELMLSPNSNDGSMWGGQNSQRGEWIELYNPNFCEPIDISCYYLGNNANDPVAYPGGYVIPPGTVVPPAGFALIRGVNANPVPANRLVENGGNVVELVVTGDGVCVGEGSRLWFPNAGGWFGFYDSEGVPQDAVSWANQSNLDQHPCTPSMDGCSLSGTLGSYNDFPNDRKNYILDQSAANFMGQSLRRIPDGGTWSGPGNPTYANCNAACVNVDYSVCTGTATATPQGGVAPYTYLWNDPENQTTQTADRLCAGEYCVQIVDAANDTIVQCIIVEDAEYDIQLSDGFCEGGSYTLPDNSVTTEAGIFTFEFETAGGCDSTVTIALEVFEEYYFELDAEICASQTYTLPDGTTANASGNYLLEYTSIYGCDSIYDINLNVIPGIEVFVEAEICPGSSYLLPDGTEVSESGTYEAIVSGGPACDTIYTVNVQLYPQIEVTPSDFSDISCTGAADGHIALEVSGGSAPYTYTWTDGINQGATASDLEAGSYSVTVSDNNGCETEFSFEIEEPSPVQLTASADTLICFGTTSTLLAEATGGTGDFTYHWSHTSATNGSQNVSPEENTSYSVYATDENGCTTETQTLYVSVISMDANQLEVSAGEPVCAGGSTTVAAIYDGAYPPYSYSWSHGLPDGPGPHNVSPEETTTYTITVTDDCGNSVAADVEVVIHPLPEISVDATDISCFGQNDGSATLNVSAGTAPFEYEWSNGGDQNTSENLEPGTYSVVVTDTENCTSSVSFTINEPDLLELEASADDLICPDEDVVLSATATGGTGDYFYHWNEDLSNSAAHTVSPDITTTYTVFASDENGCETAVFALPVEVVLMDEDLLALNPGESICAGETTSISAFYFGDHPPYTYSWSHGLPDGPGPHAVSPTESTTYLVTVSDFCGNEISGEMTVVVNPLPELSLQNVDDVTCYGLNNGAASVSVASGTPGFQYLWSGSESNNHSANNLAPGNHQVTVSDYHECLDSLQFVIAEPEPLSLSATSDTLVCPGDSVLLSVNASGGIGGYTYHWSHSNDENAEQTVAVNSNSNFTVQAVDANGCVSETDVLEVNVISMTTDLLSTISGDPACLGESTTVAAQYNGAHPPYTYLWSNGLPSTPGPHVVGPSESMTYSVLVSDQCGNSVEGEVPVEILPLPVVDLPSLLAEGCEDLRVIFTDTLNDVSNHTWMWTIDDDLHFSGNTVNYVFTEPGLHTVDLSVTSFAGCESASASSSLVMVKPSPTAAFTATPWEMEINDPEVAFTDHSEGNESWLWHFGDGQESSLQNPVYTYSDTGTYMVTLIVENNHQCTDSVSRHIVIKPSYNIIIPNAFTPTDNNNGIYDPTNPNNDIFYPFADYVQDFRMTIFNRWGEVVFESTEMNRGWNGWYRGEPCAQDVYVYKIEFIFSDGAEITKVGDITLFR